MTARIAATLVFTAAGALQLSGRVMGRDTLPAIERFLDRPSVPVSYHAHRRLEGTGPGQSAWLDAETSFSAATGLRYRVTGEGGSPYIRSRVLRALLEEERRMIAAGASAQAAISRANYRFAAEGVDAEGLVQVALQPLRKERYLITGRMFLNPHDGSLVRLEGRPAKSPSFWITRVTVVRSYRRVNDALLPVSMESIAQLQLAGAATLRMTYRYTEVNARPVREGGR